MRFRKILPVMDPLDNPSSPEQALKHFHQGQTHKKDGHNDAALTEFRRAALADPNHFETQMEIGRLCRDRAKKDAMYHRFSFEAFQKAVKLNKDSEDAHNQYILAGHKMGKLDELVAQYDAWAKQSPDNQLFQKCKMNILHMSMAMMSGPVKGNAGSEKLQKLILLGSLAVGFLGLILIISPVVILKLKPGTLTQDTATGLVKIGIFLMVVFAAGLFVRRKV